MCLATEVFRTRTDFVQVGPCICSMLCDKFVINLTVTGLTSLKYGCKYDVFVTATVNRLGNYFS